MIRLCIEPTTFEITSMQDKQNPYIDIHHTVDGRGVEKEHRSLIKQFTGKVVVYTVVAEHLPDLVFVANGGLCLPRLPERVILLPNMKYPQRQRELPYLTRIFHEMGWKTIPFTGPPFEGQAELKWFDGGKKAIGGYGHRSTKQSFVVLQRILDRVYRGYGVEPPKILVVPLESADYYHLDVAMLDLGNECIVHKRAFSRKSIEAMRKFIGKVHVLDTPDSFCLNSIVDGKHLITHKITDPKAKRALESMTGLTVREVDTREFERSGGSVRCMTLDLY